MADDNKVNRIGMKTTEWSVYVINLSPEARERYVTKLTYQEGDCRLPDPYFLDGWLDDPSQWPDISFTDIYFFLIDAPGQFTHDSLRAYKSLKAYEYVKSGYVHPIRYHNVDDKSPFCFLKTKVIPPQRLREKPHQPWICVSKKQGTVYSAHCTCMSKQGDLCSHIAALLFKVDADVRAGATSKSCETCTWDASYHEELSPTPIYKAQKLFNSRLKEDVQTVSATGKAKMADIETLRALKAVCPDAVFFCTIPPFDDEEN
ncbi:uncharacterized protein LOC124140196 [Haliotis rufescens]|uniref:uncharacterized protein LOC124140196 n=1 Tax=Haliotis rufescens TaxID=6454 RepID=UPI001EAFD272|nr:uncharacterized protein LOC124140196 [Haliotis rufescens]